MTSFVCLYRGETVGESKIVAVSADPELVAEVAAKMLKPPSDESERDPALSAMEHGRRRALRLIVNEAKAEAPR